MADTAPPDDSLNLKGLYLYKGRGQKGQRGRLTQGKEALMGTEDIRQNSRGSWRFAGFGISQARPRRLPHFESFYNTIVSSNLSL